MLKISSIVLCLAFLRNYGQCQRYTSYNIGRNPPDVVLYPMNEDLHRNGPAYLAHNINNNHNYQKPINPSYGPEEAAKPAIATYDQLEKTHSDNDSLPIPLDFLKKLNSYDDVNDLMINLVDGYEEDRPDLVSRFGEDDIDERSSAISPKSAGCMPELQTVKLVNNNDPSVVYIPQCTRIERCGGCCGSELLSCQPAQKEYVNFKVFKTQFGGGEKLTLRNKETVVVEKHTKCKCDCKIKAEDCTPLQEYRKNACKCVCANSDEKKKCLRNSELKIWNPRTCICECRTEQNCTTGYAFDPNKCICVPLPERRRNADYGRYKGSQLNVKKLQ